MATQPNQDTLILSRLTYASRAVPGLNSDDLKKILQQAHTNNQRAGITGMLCFNRHYFLQTIEGARAELSKLLTRLSLDDRHQDLQIIEHIEIPRREWAQWTMNYASPTRDNNHVFLRYSSTPQFNPYLLDAHSACNLLRELGDLQEIKKQSA